MGWSLLRSRVVWAIITVCMQAVVEKLLTILMTQASNSQDCRPRVGRDNHCNLIRFRGRAGLVSHCVGRIALRAGYVEPFENALGYSLGELRGFCILWPFRLFYRG